MVVEKTKRQHGLRDENYRGLDTLLRNKYGGYLDSRNKLMKEEIL
jgi:hypothetical protein